MSSLNKVMLIGRVGKDPEIRNTQSGQKIANLTLATSDTWNDKSSGERKEKTEWHRVSIMNDKIADVAERFVRKGSRLYIEGSLQTRKWTDNQGAEKYTTEIVIGRFNGVLTMLDGKSDGAAPTERAAPAYRQERAPGLVQHTAPSVGGGDFDEEIPF